MEQLTEEQKQALTEGYQYKYAPFFGLVSEILAEIQSSRDLVALLFINEAIETLIRDTYQKINQASVN